MLFGVTRGFIDGDTHSYMFSVARQWMEKVAKPETVQDNGHKLSLVEYVWSWNARIVRTLHFHVPLACI